MEINKKKSTSLKVGILTLSAIFILIFTVLWIKGRSLSAGERIDVIFKDVNGMRAGSGVQMMGLRIGQVEEITPVINGKDSYIKLKFVITQDGLEIPNASTVSIQQSGLVGEQFLEITPPKTQIMYVETSKKHTSIKNGQKIYMELSDKKYEVGQVEDSAVLPTSVLPYDIKTRINTPNTLKINFIITLAGLLVDEDKMAVKMINNELFLHHINNEKMYAPSKDLKYTVIEPMRISDFMEIQYKASKSLNDTNEKIAEILSDEMVASLKESIKNINDMTISATNTIEKAELLVESSQEDISEILNQSNRLISKLIDLSDNVNEVVKGDTIEEFVEAADEVGDLAENINEILEDKQTKEMISNLDDISKNLAEISQYVNSYTKDDNLKSDISSTVSNINKITGNLNNVLANADSLDDKQKASVNGIIADTAVISGNLKKFSEKLNKRFLLFRLMF